MFFITIHLPENFAFTRRGLKMCRWRDVIAGSSTPISPNRHLCSPNQHVTASTGKQLIMVGRPEALSRSLPSFRYRLSVVYKKYLNVSEQDCICLLVQCSNSTYSKTHVCYLWYDRPFKTSAFHCCYNKVHYLLVQGCGGGGGVGKREERNDLMRTERGTFTDK